MKRLTKELKPHPLNADIYDDGADDKLIQSVRENGILEPLIVDYKNRIISGHRRWDAARGLDFKEVPVELFKSENELDIQTALVEANRQRVKTNEQVAREAAQIYKIEKAKGRERQSLANRNVELPAILPEAGDARDLTGKRLGMSGKTVEKHVQVIETIDRLEKDGDHSQAETLRGKLNKTTVSSAHKVAREMGLLQAGIGEVPDDNKFILIKNWKTMSKAAKQAALAKANTKGKLQLHTTECIQWAKQSWNPITGCETGCVWCYARDTASFRGFPAGFKPAFYPDRLAYPENTDLPSEAEHDLGYKNVFTCALADLFGKWVPADLIEMVIDVARKTPKFNFLFLTKFPRRLLDFEFPNNAWVGTTVDTQARVAEAEDVFKKVKAKVKWLSCEPLLEDLTFKHLDRFDWVMVGGQNKTQQLPAKYPDREWLRHLWIQARAAGCKIFEENNLFEYCAEYPENGCSQTNPAAPLDFRMGSNIEFRNLQTAYHEAGHAVVGVSLGDKPESVTIDVEKPHYNGPTNVMGSIFQNILSPEERMPTVIDRLTLLMAGVMAQHRLCPELAQPEIWRVCGSGDNAQMKAFLRKQGPYDKGQKKEIRDKAAEKSQNLVREHWNKIQSLAKALYEKTTLHGKEIVDVMNRPLSAKEAARWKTECDTINMTVFSDDR